MDLWQILTSAATGLVASILTYMGTRRQARISEREVYIQAVEKLTDELRSEIERVNADRKMLAVRIGELRASRTVAEESVLVLKGRVMDLEEQVQELLDRIRQLEQERDQLREDLRSLSEGGKS